MPYICSLLVLNSLDIPCQDITYGKAEIYKIITNIYSLPVCKALSYLLPQTDSVFHLDLSDCLLTTVSYCF